MKRRGFLAAVGSFVGAAALGLRVSLPFVAPEPAQLVLDDMAGLVYVSDELLRDSEVDVWTYIAQAFARDVDRAFMQEAAR